MSQTDAERFLDQISKNSDLQKALQAVGAGFHAVGTEHGYRFTPDELKKALHERWSVPQAKHDPTTPDTCFF